MNSKLYITSILENWINARYKKLKINCPKDIDINQIAYFYQVFIHYRPMPARFDILGQYRAISLDSRSSPSEQREQFFHELCHILRHAGNQTIMPRPFRELQEWDANLFMMYATLPFYLIKKYDFESPYLINHLANDFNVTPTLCERRINQIKQNSFQNQLLIAEHKQAYNYL